TITTKKTCLLLPDAKTLRAEESDFRHVLVLFWDCKRDVLQKQRMLIYRNLSSMKYSRANFHEVIHPFLFYNICCSFESSISSRLLVSVSMTDNNGAYSEAEFFDNN